MTGRRNSAEGNSRRRDDGFSEAARVAKVVMQIFDAQEPIAVPQPEFATAASDPSELPVRRRTPARPRGIREDVVYGHARPSKAAGAIEQHIWPDKIAKPGTS